MGPNETGIRYRPVPAGKPAFEELYRAYVTRVYAFLRSQLGNPQDAEDVTSQVFMKAYEAYGRYEARHQTPAAWLFRIARNGFLDSRRGPRGRPTSTLSEGLRAPQQGPVGVVLSRECAARVAAAVARLPEQFRSVVLLRTQEGLAFADVAAVLDITEETARWRLFKARQMLLRDLGDYLDAGES